MERLLIIDGNSLINRAFYGVPILTTKEGVFTNAVYGFFNILVKAITEHKPKYLVVTFDHSRKTFRNDLFADYKAGRKDMPQELRPQFDIIKEILKSANIMILEQAGIEADDIIGTLAKRFSEQKIILTGDRDALQLIDDTTNVWLTKKGISDVKMMDYQTVVDDFGITPEQVIDYKAIVGDKSDNILGVKGIGDVGAVKLLKEYNTLENIYDNLSNLPSGIKEKLVNDKESAFLSQTLATIKCDCDIDCKLSDCEYEFPFNSKVFALFQKYEFNNLIKREELFSQKEIKAKKLKYTTIQIEDDAAFDAFAELCKKASKISFNSSDNISFAISEDKQYVIELTNSLFSTSLDIDACLYKLKEVFESKSILKCVYDYKESKKLLAKKGIDLVNCFDVALAGYLLEASDRGYTLTQLSENLSFNKDYALALFSGEGILTQRLKKENLYSLYSDLELPLSDVLFDMENAGLRVDKDKLSYASKKYADELSELNENIMKEAGVQFNVNSPKQLAEVLFDKLNIMCVNNKNRSTAIDVLQSLQNTHDIIPLIIRYRKIQKLKTTYIDAFEKLYNEGYIYTVFNQMVTATGRLSSKDPNMQNLPTRDEESKHIKQIFISRFDNGKLLSADYNQIELKLMAHFSNDEFMIETFKNRKDIHTTTASKIYGIAESEVTKAQRREAKAVNFGMIYGQSAFGLSQTLGISVKNATAFMNSYFATFPKVKEYMDNCIVTARENDCTAYTLLGRKRKINELNSSNHNLRNFGERVAMNMPLQGSASDIIKLAMINIHSEMKKRKYRSKLILQIHDELVFDVTEEECESMKELIKNMMENAVSLSVKLTVEIGEGDNLFDSK